MKFRATALCGKIIVKKDCSIEIHTWFDRFWCNFTFDLRAMASPYRWYLHLKAIGFHFLSIAHYLHANDMRWEKNNLATSNLLNLHVPTMNINTSAPAWCISWSTLWSYLLYIPTVNRMPTQHKPFHWTRTVYTPFGTSDDCGFCVISGCFFPCSFKM